MSRATARRGLTTLLTLACAAGAILVALAAPAPVHGPAFALTGADGALTLHNDRRGAAILQAAGLRPGDVAEGTLTLSATGAGDVALTLRRRPGAEQPGTGGGLLSSRLTLAIDDVTDASAPVSVYSGPLAGAGELPLRALSPGVPRRYRFRAAFPAGTGDNLLQGASLSAGFEWIGVAAATAPPPAPDTGGGGPPAASAPAAPAAPASPAAPAPARLAGLPAARDCVKRRRYTVTAKPRPGVKVKSITVFVDGKRARRAGRGRKGALNLKAVKRARASVRIVVATSAGSVTVTAAYRLCGKR